MPKVLLATQTRVLEAVAEKAGIEVTDEELREFVREHADAEGEEAEQVVEQVFASGRHERLREDLRMRKALDRVVGLAHSGAECSDEIDMLAGPVRPKVAHNHPVALI